MGVLTGTLIVLGVAAVVGISGAIVNYATEDERAQAEINRLKAENEQLTSARDHVAGIKTKLTSAKDYLTGARNDFNNGGHQQEPPFAQTQFSSCISKLESATQNATNLINDFNATINQNNSDISKNQAIVNKHSN